MLKALYRLLAGDPAPAKRKVMADQFDEDDPHAVLTMTEEMKASLFPKVPQMVSTIFERPPLSRPPAASGPPERSFPLI